MPKGLSVPMGVSPTGGMATVSGQDNNDKIIRLALGSGDNENAFQQDVCLGDDHVFDIADPAFRGHILNRIRKIFERFERQKRFKLLPETVEWSEGAEQETVLTFRYLDLESDETSEFTDSFRANDNG